jgi:hypothetical protein
MLQAPTENRCSSNAAGTDREQVQQQCGRHQTCATNVMRTGAATKLQHRQKSENKCGNFIPGTNGTFGKCCSVRAAHTATESRPADSAAGRKGFCLSALLVFRLPTCGARGHDTILTTCFRATDFKIPKRITGLCWDNVLQQYSLRQITLKMYTGTLASKR